MYLLGRIIYVIGGFIVMVLGLRFLFVLLGANPASSLVSFVYNVSLPFVRPFFGIFGYQPAYGAMHFEIETLVAIVVYAVATALLAGFLGGNRRTVAV